MYDLPFVPSEKPLIRHMSMVRNCLNLMKLVHGDEEEDAFVSTSFMIQMTDSMEVCKELWEELRKDAMDMGLEPDHPANRS